jgi:ubiquinone/menaquinone biosynthesis C-methylase UbiE
MNVQAQQNPDRFRGLAAIYNATRPACPQLAVDLICRYLPDAPQTIIDLGSGTGLSTLIWQGIAEQVIGIEPNDEMRAVAVQTRQENSGIRFVKALSDTIPLADEVADVITCSQSFHWMEPTSTLAEVDRLLKPGGVFAAYDCEWPPLYSAQTEMAYARLMDQVAQIENAFPRYRETFVQYPKASHLQNIRQSGHFRFTREIVFSSIETCDATRFIGIFLSQGGVQAILRQEPELLGTALAEFESLVQAEFADTRQEVVFCYRMRLGVK